MAYATTSDVQARIGAYFTMGAATKPTTTQVSDWLDQVSAIVDMYLTRRGYSTIPATGATDLLALKDPVANRVALKTLIVALGRDNLPAGFAEEMAGWDEFLEAIADGEIVLVNQAPRSRIRTMQASVYGSDNSSATLEDWLAQFEDW